MERHRFALLLLALALLSLGLRVYRLDAPSFWSDEMFQIRDALHSAWNVGYMETRWGLALSGVDIEGLAPEGYATWREAGVTEWNARIASAVLGGLTAPLLALLCAPWLGRGPALLAGLLLAVHPWHITWSQNARFYAPMFLYYNLALVLYLAGVRRTSLGWLAVAPLALVAAVEVKPTSLMLLGVVGLDLGYRGLRERRLSITGRQLAVLSGGAALGVASVASTVLGTAGAYGEFTERSLGVSAIRLLAGHAYLAGPTLCLFAAAALLPGGRDRGEWPAGLGAAVAVPLLCFAVLSTFVHVEIRYTFVALFGWCALGGVAGTRLARALRPSAGTLASALPTALALVPLLLATAIYYEPAYGNRPRWRHAFEFVRERRGVDEGIVALSSWTGRYYIGTPDILNVDLDFEGLDQLEGDTWFVVKSTSSELEKGRPHWLDPHADLRAVYPTRTAYPQDTLRVYFYDDAGRAREGRAD